MQPTAPLLKGLRRLALTTKMVNKGYYKGTGSGSMGSHTKHGGYVIDPSKVRTYVCPDLSDFKLTPFVTKKMKPLEGSFKKRKGGDAMDGMRYINKWLRNGNGQ